MANELDELMNLDPLDLSAQDIDKIIESHRRARQNYEAGVKPKKEASPKKDLSALMAKLAPTPAPAPTPASPSTFKRRF